MTDSTHGTTATLTEPAVMPVPAASPVGHAATTEADAIAAAVLSCPEVNALSSGQFGEVATYLPGRRVDGIRISTDVIDVHVVANYGVPLQQVAARIRRTLVPVATGVTVNVTFDDILAD